MFDEDSEDRFGLSSEFVGFGWRGLSLSHGDSCFLMKVLVNSVGVQYSMNENVVDFSAWCDEKLGWMLVKNAVGNDTCWLDSLNRKVETNKSCTVCCVHLVKENLKIGGINSR